MCVSIIGRDGCIFNPVISQDLSGLKMVVRFEVDACLPFGKAGSGGNAVTHHATALGGLSSAPAVQSKNYAGLVVRSGGITVAQDRLVELKTRSRRSNPVNMFDKLVPQLLLSQTPHYFIAPYSPNGTVDRIMARDEADITRRQAALQPALRRLHTALAAIQARLMEVKPGQKMSLVSRAGVLSLYQGNRASEGLSKHVLRRFNAQ